MSPDSDARTGPRLLLHIWTHKTGSTAIQHAIWESRRAPKRAGAAPIPLDATDVRALMRTRQRDAKLVDRLTAQIRRVARRAHATYQVSHEELSGDPDTRYENAPVVATQAREVTAGFADTPIVYLRRQDQFLESLHTQKVHSGCSASFQSYAASFGSDAFDWDRLVGCYAEAFGGEAVAVRRYDRAFLPRANEKEGVSLNVPDPELSECILKRTKVLAKYHSDLVLYVSTTQPRFF